MNQIIMTAIQSVIGKTVKAMPALPTGTVRFDETLTIRVAGTIEKCADEEYTPTISVPVKALAATLLPRLGATREAALATLVEAITEALNSDRKADATLRERMKDAESAFGIVNDRLLATLPKATRTGKTFVDATVVPVVAGVTASQAAPSLSPAEPTTDAVNG
jgi:hypothetical protein